MAEDRWQAFRAEMQVCQRWAYLDHAAVAPLPDTAAKTLQRWATEAAEQGDTVWPTWQHRIEQIRSDTAARLNADAAEIALVPSTTAGIGLIAEGLPWQDGDNVVTLANEFPSNLYPWLNLASRGVETRQVAVEQGRVDLQRLDDACDERTRVVALSWVGYASGWRLDVAQAAELAHRRGALLLLDAIQGLGVFPLDTQATLVDFVAADGHKWMLGPEGAGILFVRREHLARLRPLGVGWHSVRQGHRFDEVRFDLRDEAARYEGGSINMPGFLALGASLDLLHECGWNRHDPQLAERVVALGDFVQQQIEAAGGRLRFAREGSHRTGIVTFEWPGHDPEYLRRECLRAGVALSCRGGGVRVSLHGYNTSDDVARLIEALPSDVGTSRL